MPRVVHVVETFLARSEIFIYHYIKAHRTWEPLVLSQFRANETEFPADRIFTVSAPVSRREFSWWSSRLQEKISGCTPWDRRVRILLDPLNPSILHAHFGHWGYRMLAVKRALGVPLVTSFYGYDMSVLPQQPTWMKRFARLFVEGDLFLVEGNCMRSKLIGMGAPADKVVIQPIAVPTRNYPKWAPAAFPKTALFVGRFVEKKGLKYALQAVLAAKSVYPDLTFRVVGDGPGRDEAEKFIKNRRMSYVKLLGMKSHADVVRELTNAHVLIHPSVTAANGDTEGGAPTILIEAQAVGIPIVSTVHADIPNVLGADAGIFLSAEKDVSALTDNLCWALRCHAPVSQDFVAQYHDIATQVVELEHKYEAVCRHHK